MNVCFAPCPVVFDLDGTLIDSAPDIATRLSIMSIPTLLVFHKGEVAAQLIGLVQKDKIMDKLRPYL